MAMWLSIVASGNAVGVCSQPTNLPKPTQPAGLGQFLRVDGLGWVTKFFLITGQVGFGS